MAMIVLLSAKCAPGVTTSVAALAYSWPAPVVVADCDPQGGDLAAGWLADSFLKGWLHPDRGVLSFATATRHDTEPNKDILAAHLQVIEPAKHAWILTGLSNPAQGYAIGDDGWRRISTALAQLSRDTHNPVDVVVDCGRISPATPWPLIAAADLVLLAIRPVHRDLISARPAIEMLRRSVPLDRLGVALCLATTTGVITARNLLRVNVGLALPEDRHAAAVFSDGVEASRRLDRSALVRAARQAATHLRQALAPRQQPSAMSLPQRKPIPVERQSLIGVRA
jgi:cellulose biosynthesis protein BcsQ